MFENILISEIISNGKYYTALTNANDNQLHRHDFIEIFYVVAGSATHFLNGVQTELKAGDAFLLKTTDKHRFSSLNSSSFTHRDICVTVEEFKSICDFLNPELYDNILNKKNLSVKINLESLSFFEAMLNSYTSELNSNVFNEVLKTITTNILFIFKNKAFSAKKAMPDWVKQLIDYMRSPYYFQMTVSELTEDLHFSKQYICYTFKQCVGMSITDYFLKQRIDYAKYLITTTTESIQQIAYSAGFNNLTFFYRYFKKAFGSTPLEMRKKSSLSNNG